ncbi:MAG: prepilin peptidase [Candidatus Levyibacteriota bacterium]
MPLIFSIVILLIGFCIGSFINVVIDRTSKKESIITGRSYCDNCRKKLEWHELIPIVSYIVLKRKCRSCRSSLSLQYPIVEISSGVLILIAYLFLIQNTSFILVSTLSIFYYISIISSLIAIFVIDIKYGIIPNKILIFMLAVILPYSFIFEKALLLESFTSAILSFLFFFVLVLITKGKGMGFGDAKLAFIMGFFLRSPAIIVALYIAFLTGAMISLILVIWGKKHFKKSTIPFAPFLAFGAILSLFLGNQIWQYVKLVFLF